jgi:hypothetical protein
VCSYRTVEVMSVSMENTVMVVVILTVATGLGQNAVQKVLFSRRSHFEALYSNLNNVLIDSGSFREWFLNHICR